MREWVGESSVRKEGCRTKAQFKDGGEKGASELVSLSSGKVS